MKARTKLLLPLALLVVAFGAFLYGLWLPDYTREVRQRTVAVQRAYLRALAPALVEPLFKGELSAVYEVLDAQLDLHPHWLGLVLRDRPEGRLYPLTEPAPPAPEVLVLSQAVDYAGIRLGVLEARVDLQGLIQDELDNAHQLGLGMLLGLLAVTVVIALLQDRLLRHPLQILAAAASEMRRGNFAARLPAAGRDEIGQLVTAFDTMRASIERYQEELRDEAARSHAVLNNLADGILTLDASGIIQSATPMAEHIFGYTEGELKGVALPQLLATPYDIQYRDQLRAYAEHGQAEFLGAAREIEGLRKGGQPFPIDLALAALELQGRPMLTALVRDITERRAVARMQKEFISTVSHELRTPLTSIRGALGLICGGAAGRLTPRSRELVDIALNNADRLIRLINDILDIERIESGRLDLWLQPLELGGLLEETVRTQQGYAREHQVRFELTRPVPRLWVNADADRLGQVFINLLSNAAKFSPAEGVVHITLCEHGGTARVEITDHGPGIPDEFRPRIFTRFAQADGSDSRVKGGTGLGLAISKALVERMYGRIGFDSEPGRGATFYVELPLIEQPPISRTSRVETAGG